jgi:tetraacyldisaccharide 4'-kinase
MVGDEPYQMKHKFPDAHVAVDRDRCNGIRNLLDSSVQPPVDVVILDDAYQHRYVTPGLNLLLMDYHRLVCFDKLLPAGRLREHKANMRRADVVVVTKCPKTIKPMEIRGIERSLGLYTWQKLFFTYFRYGKLYPLFDKSKPELDLRDLKDGEKSVMLLTGIASPQQMEYDLEKYTDFVPLHFSDHHDFDNKDLCDIERAFDALRHGQKIIVTTEKDSVRLMNCRLRKDVADSIYVLPVEVAFMGGKRDEFNKIITGYVHKDSRNS